MIYHLTCYCKRRAKCQCGCGETITAGEVMVKSVFWKPGFKRIHYFLLDHWVEKEKAWFKNNPYARVGTGGRKKLELTDEQRRERGLILRRYAKYTQMKRIYMSRPNALSDPKVIDLINKYNFQIENLKLELENCGGVPKSWS